MGLIKDSGRREKSEGGCKAIVWVATNETERALFAARKAVEAEKSEGGQ